MPGPSVRCVGDIASIAIAAACFGLIVASLWLIGKVS